MERRCSEPRLGIFCKLHERPVHLSRRGNNFQAAGGARARAGILPDSVMPVARPVACGLWLYSGNPQHPVD